ncbi:hypothetical protein C2845_PM05G21350 [Panicum miliaceum]|uniref:Uncharacterized protein n=1 Tax=Panicum miliaceum TaxID=4540 RepID=A0A3L6SZG0_PANMI|nr:hypothetical protein C2845_PM05G21350 [Panicum miliaceum]
MSQTGFSNTSSAQHEEPAHNGTPSGHTAACSTSQRRKPRTQTKCPSDVVKVKGIDGEGFPTNDNGVKRWRLICGLIARQRVGINVKFEDMDQPTRQGLFKIMKKYLEFPEGTFEAQMNRVIGAALKSIAKLHRHFKSNLVQNFVNNGTEPFEVHKDLDHRDWETFVETTTSEQFLEKNRLKNEIMDKIFGKLRAVGIDVDAALSASIGKSSCASKEVEQTLIAPAGQHSPTSPGGRSMPAPDKCLGSSHDELETFDRLNGRPPKKKGRTTPKTAAAKKGRGKVAAAKKATEVKGKEAPKEPANTWTLAHPKFVMGKPMMTTEELASAGVNTRALHKQYISHAMHKENPSIVGEFKARDLHSGPGYFSIAWQLNKESKERQLGVAFIDPQHFSATVIAQDPDHVQSTISKDMLDDKDKLEKQQLLAIREKVASFLLVDVIYDKESRWLPNPSCAPGSSRKRKMILLGSSIKGDGQQPKPVTFNIHQVTAPGSIARHL